MDIDALQKQVDSEVKSAQSAQALEELRVKYLGRKGIVTQCTGMIPQLEPDKRQAFGRQVNSLKDSIISLIEEQEKVFSQKPSGLQAGPGDITLPGIAQVVGRLHPLTQVMDEILAVFSGLGFAVVQGPEVETEFNNFTGLNIPLEHPSRDAFDTFYLQSKEPLLLRSHTSPAQVRVMLAQKPPLAVVVPGRVYRPDAVDASHSFMFHQIEGFMVDQGLRFSDLKGILEVFAKSVFGEGIKMRFRPHFFPFTEPSAEIDISCIICKGSGCSVCGRKGWLEILGSGMIHPNVFRHVGYDSKKFTGFAFGMGVERIAMLKYGIDDIRLFFENDLRFLNQF